MGDWLFELAEAKSMRKIGELTQARDRSLTLTLDKPGAFQMRLPLTDAIARKVEEIATCVIVKRMKVPVWSGPVVTVTETTPDSLAVGCVGWQQLLEKRLIYPVGSLYHPAWTNLQYNEVNDGDIILDLLRQSNADNSFSDTNFVVPGIAEQNQARTKTYQPWNSLLGAINELSDIESGYDMIVDPMTRKLNTYQKIGQLKPEVLYAYGVNVSSATRTCDAMRVCNRMIAYSSIGWAQADDLISQQVYGPMEEAVSLSDVRDIGILQAYANAELAVRSVPLRFHSFDPLPYSSQRSEYPRIFEDFSIGDSTYMKVDRGRLKIPKQAVRIFGATIAFDDNTGQENLSSLQTTFTS